MANYSTFNEPLVNNSIINNLNDQKLDRENPFSFMDFLGYTRILDDSLENVDIYKKYLNKWDNATINKSNNETDLIKKQFTDLFKTIILEYTNEEEKRYFSNINLNSEEDLTIAIPFFSKKIKEICQYYQSKRSQYKRDLNQINKKGSVKGVEAFIKNKLVDLIYGDNADANITRSLTLSSFIQNVEIEIEEGYDVYNDIYDTDAAKVQSFTVEEFYEPPPIDPATGAPIKVPFSAFNAIPRIPKTVPSRRNDIPSLEEAISAAQALQAADNRNFYDSPTVNKSVQIIEKEIVEADVLLTTTPLPVTTPPPPTTTPEPVIVRFSSNFWKISNDKPGNSNFKNLVIAHDAHNTSYSIKNYIDWGDNSRLTTFTQRVTASHDYINSNEQNYSTAITNFQLLFGNQVTSFDFTEPNVKVTYSPIEFFSPASTHTVNDFWFDTSSLPYKIYQWTGTEWVEIEQTTQLETLVPGNDPRTVLTPGVTTTTTPAPNIPPPLYNYNPDTGDWF